MLQKHVDLPHLALLPINQVIIHEWHDEQRTPPLRERIRANGFLRNPPVVTPLQDDSGRYMVLDGTNRIYALKQLGVPHVLVQIVQPDNPGLQLQTWNHVVRDLTAPDLPARVSSLDNISLIHASRENDHIDLWGECCLALLKTAEGDMFAVSSQRHELLVRVNFLNSLVDIYKSQAHFDRTNERRVENLRLLYPDLSGLVIFPQFKVHQLLYLASAGYLLPAGITRFSISPRALHINYPLDELAADKPITEKEAALQNWIQERLASKRVRYYAEATFLYDD